jgi:hypothetical protein
MPGASSALPVGVKSPRCFDGRRAERDDRHVLRRVAQERVGSYSAEQDSSRIYTA